MHGETVKNNDISFTLLSFKLVILTEGNCN